MQLLKRKSSSVLPPFLLYLPFPVFLLSPFFSLPTYRLHLHHSAVLRLSPMVSSRRHVDILVDETALPMAENANDWPSPWPSLCKVLPSSDPRQLLYSCVDSTCCSGTLRTISCELGETLLFQFFENRKRENKHTPDYRNTHNTHNAKLNHIILCSNPAVNTSSHLFRLLLCMCALHLLVQLLAAMSTKMIVAKHRFIDRYNEFK